MLPAPLIYLSNTSGIAVQYRNCVLISADSQHQAGKHLSISRQCQLHWTVCLCELQATAVRAADTRIMGLRDTQSCYQCRDRGWACTGEEIHREVGSEGSPREGHRPRPSRVQHQAVLRRYASSVLLSLSDVHMYDHSRRGVTCIDGQSRPSAHYNSEPFHLFSKFLR